MRMLPSRFTSIASCCLVGANWRAGRHHYQGCGTRSGSAAGHSQMALELQRRHVGLGRDQQVDRRKSGAQRQLRRFEQHPAQQCRLVSTVVALVVDLALLRALRMGSSRALRTPVSSRDIVRGARHTDTSLRFRTDPGTPAKTDPHGTASCSSP